MCAARAAPMPHDAGMAIQKIALHSCAASLRESGTIDLIGAEMKRDHENGNSICDIAKVLSTDLAGVNTYVWFACPRGKSVDVRRHHDTGDVSPECDPC